MEVENGVYLQDVPVQVIFHFHRIPTNNIKEFSVFWT